MHGIFGEVKDLYDNQYCEVVSVSILRMKFIWNPKHNFLLHSFQCESHIENWL